MLYESYIHPITILSTLPSAGVGALLALLVVHDRVQHHRAHRHHPAHRHREEERDHDDRLRARGGARRGLSPEEAIHQACLLRFRPILMTTLAALLGGAAAGARQRHRLGAAPAARHRHRRRARRLAAAHALHDAGHLPGARPAAPRPPPPRAAARCRPRRSDRQWGRDRERPRPRRLRRLRGAARPAARGPALRLRPALRARRRHPRDLAAGHGAPRAVAPPARAAARERRRDPRRPRGGGGQARGPARGRGPPRRDGARRARSGRGLRGAARARARGPARRRRERPPARRRRVQLLSVPRLGLDGARRARERASARGLARRSRPGRSAASSSSARAAVAWPTTSTGTAAPPRRPSSTSIPTSSCPRRRSCAGGACASRRRASTSSTRAAPRPRGRCARPTGRSMAGASTSSSRTGWRRPSPTRPSTRSSRPGSSIACPTDRAGVPGGRAPAVAARRPVAQSGTAALSARDAARAPVLGATSSSTWRRARVPRGPRGCRVASVPRLAADGGGKDRAGADLRGGSNARLSARLPCLPGRRRASMYAVAIGTRKLAPSQARVALGILAALGLVTTACTGQVGGGAGPSGGAGAGTSAPGTAGATSARRTGSGHGRRPGPGRSGSGPSSLLGLSGGAEPAAHMHKLTASRVHEQPARSPRRRGARARPSSPTTSSRASRRSAPRRSRCRPRAWASTRTRRAPRRTTSSPTPTRAAAVLSCVPTGTTDTACASKALAAFGRRAFRRPLTAAETTRFVTLATTIAAKPGSSVLAGMRHAVWAMLQSPSFLYRVELGAASAADGGRLKYTTSRWRRASRRRCGAPCPTIRCSTRRRRASSRRPPTCARRRTRMLADARVHRSLVGVRRRSVRQARARARRPRTRRCSRRGRRPCATPCRRSSSAASTTSCSRRRATSSSLYESKTTFVNNELATYYGLPTQATDGWRAATFPADSPRVGPAGRGRDPRGLRAAAADVAHGAREVRRDDAALQDHPRPAARRAAAAARWPTRRRRCARSWRCTARPPRARRATRSWIRSASAWRTSTARASTARRTTASPSTPRGRSTARRSTGSPQLGAAVHARRRHGPVLREQALHVRRGPHAQRPRRARARRARDDVREGGNHVDQLLLDLVTSDAFRFVTPDP